MFVVVCWFLKRKFITCFEVSQKGIQMFDCRGCNDKMPVESCMAGVPISVKPSQERVDSGLSEHPISFFSIANPENYIYINK